MAKTKLDPIAEYKDDMDEFVTLVNGSIVELEWRIKTYDILYDETHDENYKILIKNTSELLTKWKKLGYFLTQCERSSI